MTRTWLLHLRLTHGLQIKGDDENWMKHTLSWLDKPYVEDAKVILKYRSVIDQPLDKDPFCGHCIVRVRDKPFFF